MTTPVFLSVGGARDTEFAKAVHNNLGEALAYHYQVTGEETANFRAEIEGKINSCHIFVVFWSQDYLNSEHACNELAYFRKLTESKNLDKKLIVVQCKKNGPDIQGKWKNPITQKNDDYILGDWRSERAIDPEMDANHVAQIIRRKLEHLTVLSNVLIPRGWLTDQFKREISLQDFKAREFVFVTGMEGHGRRTALRQYLLQAYPHRVERTISIDSIDGPDDLLISVMEVAALPASERQKILKNIEEGSSSVDKEIRKLLHQARENKSYYVIAIDRFAGVDAVAVPAWLSTVMSVFSAGNAPLIFVVTSSPVTDKLLAHYPGAGRVRVPGLEDNEMNELVHRLTFEDPVPSRWSLEKKMSIATTSGSSPSMCKSIMRSLAVEQTLDFVDEIALRAEKDFGQSLASLMAHWVHFYSDKPSDLLALAVIEKLGVASKDALDEIMQPAVAKYGEFDLYTMRDQGLVEQLSDGIYRIPPLVQRRLGDAIWAKLDKPELDRLFSIFSKQTLIAKSEYGAIYASNAAAASLRSGGTFIAKEYESYLTISTLFKAALDKYSNSHWAGAHVTFQRAMSRLLKKTSVVDLSTEIEIARFSGLAAARQSELIDMDLACTYLETQFSKTKRAKSAIAMAKFVRGFRYRLEKKYSEAVEFLLQALDLLQNQHSVERQRAAVYTELASAYLRMNPPRYEQALKMARAAFKEKDVTHTLNSLVHTLILYVYRSQKIKDPKLTQNYIEELESFLKQLEIRSNQYGKDFYHKRLAEYNSERNRFINRKNNSQPIKDDNIDQIELTYL